MVTLDTRQYDLNGNLMVPEKRGYTPGIAHPTGVTSTTPAGPDTSKASASERDALAQFRNYLIQLGMDEATAVSLVEWGWQQIQQGKSSEEFELELLQRPEIKAAFPELEARRKQGRPVSIETVLAYRNQAKDMMHALGLPNTFADNAYLSKLIVGDVSLPELQDRITLASQAVYNATPEFQAELDRYYSAGYTHADAVAMALDADVAEPLIAQRFAAARLGAQGLKTGFGQIERSTAEALARQGVTESEAQQGFGYLASNSELMQALPGEIASTISKDTQIDAAFSGNAAARQRIERSRRKRQSTFSGGGSLAGGREGVSGVGSAAN